MLEDRIVQLKCYCAWLRINGTWGQICLCPDHPYVRDCPEEIKEKKDE